MQNENFSLNYKSQENHQQVGKEDNTLNNVYIYIYIWWSQAKSIPDLQVSIYAICLLLLLHSQNKSADFHILCFTDQQKYKHFEIDAFSVSGLFTPTATWPHMQRESLCVRYTLFSWIQSISLFVYCSIFTSFQHCVQLCNDVYK